MDGPGRWWPPCPPGPGRRCLSGHGLHKVHALGLASWSSHSYSPVREEKAFEGGSPAVPHPVQFNGIWGIGLRGAAACQRHGACSASLPLACYNINMVNFTVMEEDVTDVTVTVKVLISFRLFCSY